MNNYNPCNRPTRVIRVGFFVIYGSAFPAWPLVELMLRTDSVKFEVVIIAAPDTMRGKENMLEQLNLVMDHFSGNDKITVRSAYDHSTGGYKDCSHDLDYACIINPYEHMTADVCRATYLHSKGLPSFFIHYTYSVSKFDLDLYCQKHFNYFWRVYLSSTLTREELLIKGKCTKNLKVVGYPKLDAINYRNDSRGSHSKQIIIAPHHTFGYKYLNIGAFDKFYLAYLELPKRYPNVNFVFRPHPLWKTNIKGALGWSDDKVNMFLDDLLMNENVSYSTEFNYIDLLNKSDALIHDCGSFTAEYLHTSKPCCFMMNDPSVYRNFNSIGKMCLDLHYHASSSDEVFDFIDRVVLEGNDPLQGVRDTVVKTYLLNHRAKASEFIINDILLDYFETHNFSDLAGEEGGSA